MEKRESRQAETAQARPARTPLGTRNILTVSSRPGYHRCWVGDSTSQRPSMEDYVAAGYTYVEESLSVGDNAANAGSTVLSRVTRPGGQGVTLYLMEIKEEYYLEDQKIMENTIKEQEAQMFDARLIEGGYGTAKQKVNQKDFNTPDL